LRGFFADAFFFDAIAALAIARPQWVSAVRALFYNSLCASSNGGRGLHCIAFDALPWTLSFRIFDPSVRIAQDRVSLSEGERHDHRLEHSDRSIIGECNAAAVGENRNAGLRAASQRWPIE